MKIKIFFVICFLVLMPLVLAEEVKIGNNFYASVDNPEILDNDDIRNLGREIRWQSSSLFDILHFFYFIDSFEKIDEDKFAKSKFIELKLHEEGIPILNLLVLYSIQEKDIKIVYPAGCIYDKNELDELAKSTAENMKNSEDYTSFVNLVERLQIIGNKKFEETKNNPVLYCPALQTKEYEVEEIKREDYCKSFFESDKFDFSRLKILILGNDFDNENEFKEAINQYVLKKGFQKIEPFKTYTEKGEDGLFYFVYGSYDIKEDLGVGSKNCGEKINKDINNEISKCSNVFYTIILNSKKKDEDFRSFYHPELKTSFNVLNGEIIMHETGHRFKLSDEYTGVYALSASINSIFNHFQLSCSKNPEEHWESVLDDLGDYKFKTCSGSDLSYRSSFQSIMRNTYVYDKFNFLSCLFLVREFEGVGSINNEKVNEICKTMYDSGEIQKPSKISDEDFDYKKCIKQVNKAPYSVDCKKLLLECSKEESMTNGLNACILKKSLEVENQI